MRAIVFKTCFTAFAVLAFAGVAAAEDVRLLTVRGVKAGVDLIIPDYTKETGNKVVYTFGGPAQVVQKLAAGEVFDVVVVSEAAMNDLAKLGGIKAGPRVPVVRGGVGVVVRKDAPALDISTPESFKKTLMAAKSIAIGDPTVVNTSGVLVDRILTKTGIRDAIKPKLKVVGLDPAMQAISKGEIEIGLYNVSEVADYVKCAGPVPAPLQETQTYEAALLAKGSASGAATALIKMFASDRSAARWKAAGMFPLTAK